MANSQFAALSSNLTRKTKFCSNQCIPRWANPFPVPQPAGEDHVVVDKAFGTLEQGVTRVSTNLCSTLNVEHMQARVLMGNMFGQPLEARLIKWKLGLLWKNDVKHTFYLDHYGRKWLALEFTGVCSNNRPWPPRLPVRYKEENIIKVIAQPLSDIIKVDEIPLVLNGVFVKGVEEGLMDMSVQKKFGWDHHEEDGWTTAAPKWKKKVEKRQLSEKMGEGRSQRDLGKEGKVAKYKWTLRADLVQDWRRSPRHEDAMNEVSRIADDKGPTVRDVVDAVVAEEGNLLPPPPPRPRVGVMSPKKGIREEFVNQELILAG
ncbi:hypothetical protein ACFX15_027057 [Malus domestica]